MTKSLFLLYLLQHNLNIRNVEFPSCKNCKHFMPNSVINNDFTSTFSRCNKFGEKNIISDKVTYDYVDVCRLDTTKCGPEGKYFEKEKNINFKILKHFIVSNGPYWFLAIGILLPPYLKFIFR